MKSRRHNFESARRPHPGDPTYGMPALSKCHDCRVFIPERPSSGLCSKCKAELAEMYPVDEGSEAA